MVVVLLLLFSFVFGDVVPSEDPYKVLGVSRSTSQGDIRKAYKKLALQFHPDKNPGEEAAARFSAINAAYDIIGNPDKRAVYDDFGKSSTGHTGFHSFWEFQQSNTKSDNDFYVGDSLITRLTEKLWDERLQGDSIWLVNAYAPWCTHCQQAISKYKALAGRLDGIVEVGAINCHKDQQFCQRMGIGEYPTFRLVYKKLNFEEKFQVQQGIDIENALYDWVMPRVTEWKQLSTHNPLVSLNTGNYDPLVRKARDFWIVMFTSGHAKEKCSSARVGLVRMAGKLQGLAKVGIVDCDTDTPLCASENPGISLFYHVFPIFRVYSRGRKDKISEELFKSTEVQPSLALAIIEKTVLFMLKNKKIDNDKLGL